MDAIHLPSGVTPQTSFGAPPGSLQPGQVIQALVLELIEGVGARLQLPHSVVDVRSDVPLTPGSTITVAMKGSGANARLVIYAEDGTTPRSPVVPANGDVHLPSLVGRQPIGEAIIVARTTIAPHGKAGIEPGVTADAPSISPARPLARPPEVQARLNNSPAQALGAAVAAAATRQGGLAPLFADVEQVMHITGDTLPAPVRAAANELLGLRVPLDEKLTAAAVKQAFMRSGVLFEPHLAAEGDGHAPDVHLPGAAPMPSGDLKAALLVLRQVLKAWAASEPATAPARAATPSLAASPSATPSTTSSAAPATSQTAAPATAPAASSATPPATSATTAPATPAATTPGGTPALGQQEAVWSALFPKADAASIKQLMNSVVGLSEEMLLNATPLSAEEATHLAKSIATTMMLRNIPVQPASIAAPGGPPPPYRGAPMSGQAPMLPSIPPNSTPHDAAERLLVEADGAIARATLLQAASLPDQPNPNTQRNDPAAQRWTFEVPFTTPQGTGVAQFEVSRDAPNAGRDEQARTWRVRFSLDVEPMGPVHALIVLEGERASVMLWAERPATVTKLNEHAPQLGEALRAVELEPSDFIFRVGAPNTPKQAAPGKFMDRAS